MPKPAPHIMQDLSQAISKAADAGDDFPTIPRSSLEALLLYVGELEQILIATQQQQAAYTSSEGYVVLPALVRREDLPIIDAATNELWAEMRQSVPGQERVYSLRAVTGGYIERGCEEERARIQRLTRYITGLLGEPNREPVQGLVQYPAGVEVCPHQLDADRGWFYRIRIEDRVLRDWDGSYPDQNAAAAGAVSWLVQRAEAAEQAEQQLFELRWAARDGKESREASIDRVLELITIGKEYLEQQEQQDRQGVFRKLQASPRAEDAPAAQDAEVNGKAR